METWPRNDLCIFLYLSWHLPIIKFEHFIEEFNNWIYLVEGVVSWLTSWNCCCIVAAMQISQYCLKSISGHHIPEIWGFRDTRRFPIAFNGGFLYDTHRENKTNKGSHLSISNWWPFVWSGMSCWILCSLALVGIPVDKTSYMLLDIQDYWCFVGWGWVARTFMLTC